MRNLFFILALLGVFGLFAAGCKGAEEAPAPAPANATDIAVESADQEAPAAE